MLFRSGNVDEGSRTHPAFADLDNDGILEMVVGNLRGGLGLFKTTLVDCSTVAVQQPATSKPQVQISPNPARDWLRLSVQPASALRWRALNALGQVVATGESSGSPVNIQTTGWKSGVYFIEISMDGQLIGQKVVVER